jgi:hypothetical protein
MVSGTDFRSTVDTETGTAGLPAPPRPPAACAEVSPPAEHATVAKIAAMAKAPKHSEDVKLNGMMNFTMFFESASI